MGSDSESSGSGSDTGALEVAVQLSRFHMETIEGSATGDVDIRGLCLSVGDRELLTDAHLSLRRGTRYGLVGRNGTGKSTLLKACANRAIPGLPRDMKVLYVQQDNVPGDLRTPLQTVLDAGSPRGALQARVSELEAALEAEGEAAGQRLVACVREVLAGRAEEVAEEAEQTAARRSRARGKEATKGAVAAREAARRAQQEQLTPDKAASLAPQLLADLYDSLDQLGGREEDEEAAAVAALRGLGFGERQLGVPTRELSGGWRMRVALACALLSQPHLLLLDEPTNHLDLMSILWLQDYLTSRCPPGQTVVLVSHDRAFLSAVATETLLLRAGRLEYFPGTYDAYMQAKAETAVHKERQMAGQERQRVHLADTIARAERAAREAGDDKRLLQAASRRKKMDRLGAEKTADGRRFKVSYWAGWHETLRPQVELDRPEEPVVLQLPSPEPLRQRGPLLQLRDVTVAYRGNGNSKGGGGDGGGGGSSDVPLSASTTTTTTTVAASTVAPSGAAPPGKKGGEEKGRAPASVASVMGKLKKSAGQGRVSGKEAAPVARPAAGSAGAAVGSGGGGAGGSSSSDGGAAVVLSGVTMDVEQGARIGLLGLNGSGKSSLLRVMSGALAPAVGEVTFPCGSRVVVGRLNQHSARRLLLHGGGEDEHGSVSRGSGSSSRRRQRGSEAAGEGEAGIGGMSSGKRASGGGGGGCEGKAGASTAPSSTPATAFSMVQAQSPSLKPQEVYDYLGKFAVPGPVASTPLAALSGGQRCRVALALEMLLRPQLLLLDEPTNHLDLLTVQALGAAVREWEGAVVIASHDLQFLKDTCAEVWVVEAGHVNRQTHSEPAEAVDAYAARLRERLRRQADKEGRRL